MKDTIRSIGLDIHKDSIAIAIAEEGGGEPQILATIPNELNILLKHLRRLGPMLPSAFTFSGTGTIGTGGDADPSAYIVEHESVAVSLGTNTPIEVYGFVKPFGSAPPDFDSFNCVDVSDSGTLLEVVWSAASTQEMTRMDSGELVLDLSSSPANHHVFRAGTSTNVSGAAVSLVPNSEGSGFFAIVDAGVVTLHHTFRPSPGTSQTTSREARTSGSSRPSATTRTVRATSPPARPRRSSGTVEPGKRLEPPGARLRGRIPPRDHRSSRVIDTASRRGLWKRYDAAVTSVNRTVVFSSRATKESRLTAQP